MASRRALSAALAGGVLLLAGCQGGCSSSGDEPASTPPARTPTPAPPAPTASPVPTATPAGSLAVGLTEQNPNFIWPRGAHAVAPEFARWTDAVDRLKPAYYRLVLDWPSLEPQADRPVFDAFTDGCQRGLGPCGAYGGLRDTLRALAARQRQGGWAALAVVTGTPAWAAHGPGGCERAGTQPRSRAPDIAAYGRFVSAVLEEARRDGAELRYWTPWNEPNHPYFISPQRRTCDASAPSAAVAPYVEMARELARQLDAAPGDQQLVLGELAGLDERKPKSTSVGEFVADLPADLACGSPIWTQHGYVGGHDPVKDLEGALRRKGCPPRAIWITETGVGAPRSGEARRTSHASEVRACSRLHARLRRWYRDPAVTAAFQYTFREDALFPTGLVKPDLSRAYPALFEWTAWGGAARANPTDPPPPDRCEA